MQALEFNLEIDNNKQIHLQLPQHIHAHKARVIVMYDEVTLPLKPIKLGLFASKITISDDFNDPLPDSFWLGEAE